VYYCFAPRIYYSRTVVKIGAPFSTNLITPSKSERHARRSLEKLSSPQVIERTARKFAIRGNARDIALKNVFKTSISFVTRRELAIEIWTATPALARDWTPELLAETQWLRDARDSSRWTQRPISPNPLKVGIALSFPDHRRRCLVAYSREGMRQLRARHMAKRSCACHVLARTMASC
jgi:hypothetical protein